MGISAYLQPLLIAKQPTSQWLHFCRSAPQCGTSSSSPLPQPLAWRGCLENSTSGRRYSARPQPLRTSVLLGFRSNSRKLSGTACKGRTSSWPASIGQRTRSRLFVLSQHMQLVKSWADLAGGHDHMLLTQLHAMRMRCCISRHQPQAKLPIVKGLHPCQTCSRGF